MLTAGGLWCSQGLDGAQGGEQAFADCLQLVVVQRQQVEVLQVLEGVDPQTVDFVGVQQPETQEEHKSYHPPVHRFFFFCPIYAVNV